MSEIPTSLEEPPEPEPEEFAEHPVIPNAASTAIEHAATRLFAIGRAAVRFNIGFPLS
jgi:hypothetical protein